MTESNSPTFRKQQMELPKQYDPQQAQTRLLEFWSQRGYFHSKPEHGREPFTIVIPPPNVTGALHMGHALNNTLQDVLIRWRRMQGYNALYMPGTDHAGIATQAVVERLIYQQEKKTRHEIGREELVKRIWQWKDKYESRILGQLRQLGASCDWERTRFTLDPVCARAVRQTFFNLFRDGLIFRGKRLVNWDTHLQTAVADDEIFHETVKGGFWTFRYPVKAPGANAPGSPEFIRFSTTRPETMLGDTAVAVHPDDPRYKHMIGRSVTIPLVSRDIPIIADPILVDPKLGTGAVKVTPAHDFNDYQCGVRNKLPMINILNPDGTINQNGGKYAGMDRYQAREEVTKEMEALGLFEGKEDRDIELAHSDRSKTPIEPYLSDQWFVKTGDPACGLAVAETSGEQACDAANAKPQAAGLAQMAMDAVTDGRVKFFPERYAKTYLDWLGEKRDWCISRQLWWGHRIPVWHLTVGVRSDSGLTPRAKAAVEQDLVDLFMAAGVYDHISTGSDAQGYFQFCPLTDEAESVFRTLEQIVDAAQGAEPSEEVVREHGNLAPFYRRAAVGISLRQDPDVLDTWFSSALWPHSTLGWPEQTQELAHYYPTSVLVTSRDIITLWVARMVMTGLYNIGKVPFHKVYIHPKMLDGFGETMSKSKGNGIDPLDIIERYGADALRFQMVFLAGETQDSRLPVANVCPHCEKLVPVKAEHMGMRTKKVTCPECKKPFRPGGPWPSDDPDLPTAKQASDRFEVGRNFANKIWNAARFIMLNLEGYAPQALKVEELPIEDRWILSRLASTTEAVTENLDGFHFSDVARTLYDFVWSEFCDWYVEMAKGRLKDEGGRMKQDGDDSSFLLPPSSLLAQRVLVGVLDGILRLVHPIMPFVADSVWQALNDVAFERGLPGPEPATESVVIAAWPMYPASWKDAGIERRMARMQELVRAVREVRNRYNVDPKTSLDVFVRAKDEVAADFNALTPFITQLGGVGKLACGPDVHKPPQAASHVTPDFEAYVSLAGLIDVAAEVKRLDKQLAEKKKFLQAMQAKLENPNFVNKAPADVVQQQREQVADLQKQIDVLESSRRELEA
jgi:valyl-tRNA synthetase